jgi:hypothetical protein
VQSGPLVLDDRSDVGRDGAAHPIGLGCAQGLVVAHDGGKRVRLGLDVGARVILVLNWITTTKARSRPKNAASTPSIAATISELNSSRVAGT